MTKAEEKAAKAAYEKHRAACREYGLLPEHFNRFLAEFVEVRRKPAPDGEGKWAMDNFLASALFRF